MELSLPLEFPEEAHGDALPGSVLLPVLRSPPAGHPRPVAFSGEIRPAAAGREDVEDPVDGLSIIRSASAGTFRRRKEVLEEFPFGISEIGWEARDLLRCNKPGNAGSYTADAPDLILPQKRVLKWPQYQCTTVGSRSVKQ